MNERSNALTQVSLLYLLTAAVGTGTYVAASGTDIWRFLYADLAMTLVIFAASLVKKNSSAYDAYWSVIPFYFILAFLALSRGQGWNWAQWGVAILVSTWSWRLTLNWVRSWPGWDHEDWRYVMFREQLGPRFQLMNFFGIHLYPTIAVFLGCWGLFWVYSPSANVVPLNALGLGLGFLGVALEFIADNELARFRTSPGRKQEDVLNTGIWAYSRNPNYLGEMLFWFGVALCGFAAGGPWYTGSGAVGMVALFFFASIPMKEQRMLARRPAFADYQAQVPMVFPTGRHAQ